MFTSLVGLSTLIATGAVSRLHCDGDCLRSHDPLDSPRMYGIMEEKRLFWHEEEMKGLMGTTPSRGAASCDDGYAGEYACSKIDLGAFVSHADLGSTELQGSDIWGWTDEEGNEFAIAACSDGTSFVDVTDPVAPVVLGFLPTTTDPSNWRDMKVYKGHAFIGSEARNHGLQVFDLSQLSKMSTQYRKQLRSVNKDIEKEGHVKLGVTFNTTAEYHEFGSSHNIVINEETGFLYAVGTKTCVGGLHVVDITEPADPQFVSCYSADGYTHDAECVVYRGPDATYQGREICFNYNEDTLTIVDVSDKHHYEMLSRTTYQGAQYTHQGWLNEAQTHLVMDDEKDEMLEPALGGHTRSIIWDVSSLANPHIVGNVDSEQTAIDHNQYIHKGYVWQSNYCAGLRVLDEATLESGSLEEVAFFDVSPECDTPVFAGAWSVYPYFPSGTVVVQSIEKGLFVLQPKL